MFSKLVHFRVSVSMKLHHAIYESNRGLSISEVHFEYASSLYAAGQTNRCIVYNTGKGNNVYLSFV